jgi:PST family polysaccharide transporter
MLVQTVDRFGINKEVYFVTFGMVLGQVLFPAWLFQGLEQMKFLVWLTISSKLFFTVLVFKVVQAPEDYLWVPVLNGMGTLLTGLLALHILSKRFKIKFKWPALKTLKYQILEGWYVFYSSIAISLYASSTTFILCVYSSDVAVGHYSAAERLIQAAKSIYSAFSQAIFPQISRRIDSNRKAGLDYVRNTALIICTVMFLLSTLLYLSSESLVKILFGQQYQSTIFLVKIMAFTPFIVSLSNIFGVQIMLNLGYKRAFSAILTAAAVFGVTINIALFPAYKEQGAAVSILIVESFVTIAMYVFLKLYERGYAGIHKK